MTAVRASRAALPSLVERGGRIVNISSINARLPQPQVIDYAVAKAALTSLSKGLAEEYGPDGVRVNTVSPGPVRTPLWEAEGSPGQVMATAMADGDHGGFLAGVPDAFGMTIGRFVEPSEVGALVVLLVSDRSGAVNGSDWVIDGGMLKSY
jgi:NAD(P)-dependent dehydrogenase (short-subunit alcohol dehydrogenase family)